MNCLNAIDLNAGMQADLERADAALEASEAKRKELLDQVLFLLSEFFFVVSKPWLEPFLVRFSVPEPFSVRPASGRDWLTCYHFTRRRMRRWRLRRPSGKSSSTRFFFSPFLCCTPLSNQKGTT